MRCRRMNGSIRTLIDIIAENNLSTKDYKVTEINATGDVLVNEIGQYIAYCQFLPSHLEYKLFVTNVDTISTNAKEKATEWDAQQMPKLTKNHLIIIRDSPRLYHLKIDAMVEPINDAIVENGFLIIIAKYRLTEPEKALNSLFKQNITDSVLQERIKTLTKAFEDVGLLLVARKSDSISTMAMMFRKVSEKKKIPETSEVLEVKTERDELWLQPIKDRIEAAKDELDNAVTPKNVWLIARDSCVNGIIGFTHCLRLEPGGECFRCLFDMDSNIELPIDWTAKPFCDILTNDLAVNVIKDGKLGTYRYTKLADDYDKILSDKYFLNQGATRDLSSLSWFDISKVSEHIEPRDWMGRPINTVPVNIYSSGLIFKDVMFATGQ